jgi:hypothetical protein
MSNIPQLVGNLTYMPGAPGYGFRKAPTGSVPRAVVDGRWRRFRSLPLAALIRRLNPDLGGAQHIAPNLHTLYFGADLIDSAGAD